MKNLVKSEIDFVSFDSDSFTVSWSGPSDSGERIVALLDGSEY